MQETTTVLLVVIYAAEAGMQLAAYETKLAETRVQVLSFKSGWLEKSVVVKRRCCS